MENTKVNNIQSEGLKKEDIERYCRQIILGEIGLNGQNILKNSKVLIIGAGGLGSPCLLYLSGAGIGEIGIVDGDSVDQSNLHRQIIHSTCNKGMNKSKSASMLINGFNPLVKINIYEEHFINKNALKIAENYDLLIDCTDNPATRYLINDVSVVLKKPLVSGSAVKWEGQLTIYGRDSTDEKNYNKLPCYRCLFPIPSPTSAVCNCADAGVFGPVPGVIGTMQSNEAVKLLLGEKERILSKRMLIYDALEMTFKIFKLRNWKNDCAVCGDDPTITKETISTFDYENFVNPISCRVSPRIEIPEENKIDWKTFIEKAKNFENDSDSIPFLFLDVRPNDQFNLVNLSNKFKFINCPLKEIKMNFEKCEKEILQENKNLNIFVMCKLGNASTHATKFLLEKGYNKVFNINDGLAKYRKEIDNEVPIY